MARIFLTAFSFLLFLLSFPFQAFAAETPAFITIINPIRDREFWHDRGLLERHILASEKYKLPATWLLGYDVLDDEEVTERLKKTLPRDELGVLLEVSEDLATDAQVPYLIGEGDWARADKVFLSGYEPAERKRMIDALFKNFKDVFGDYPRSVGAWYIDAVSLNYLFEKYKIVSVLDCADQYSTDNYQIWGKPWGVPFYPSRFNSLIPAQTLKNKLPVVKIQWALRDPKRALGPTVLESTFSLQANDYQGHHNLGVNYFEELLNIYLKTQSAFSQATVGLEVGQEAKFLPEFERQLQVVARKKEKEGVSVLTMGDFGIWYRNTFPNFSPPMEIKTQEASWSSTPFERKGLLKIDNKRVEDVRFYREDFLEADLLSADKREKLYRVVPEGQVINLLGRNKPQRFLNQAILRISSLPWPTYHFPPVFWTRIDKSFVIGFKIGPTKIIGLKVNPVKIGVFTYPFQTLVRFKTWPRINLLGRIFKSDSQILLEEFKRVNKDKDLLYFSREDIDVLMEKELEKSGFKKILETSENQAWGK